MGCEGRVCGAIRFRCFRVSETCPSLAIAAETNLSQDLTHLLLDNADLVPSGAISFPSLSHLGFSDPSSVTNVLAFLNTSQLPRLTSLPVILWTRFRDDEHLRPMQEILSSLAPRLEGFHFEASGALVLQDLQPFFCHFASLRHLSLTVPDPLLPALQAIPCQLSTLRIFQRAHGRTLTTLGMH